jgi:signal transduction histidine kinase/ABC-type uncharacterized transport system substrate-binding protein
MMAVSPWLSGALRILAGVSLWVVLAFPCLAPAAHAADVQGQKVVLLLYAADRAQPVPAALDQAIRTTLETGARAPVQFFTELIDLSWLSSKQYEQRLASVLREKYADVKIDLIVSVSSAALRFLVKHRTQLFPELPIVFCGVNAEAVDGLELGPDIRGVRTHPGWSATLDAALTLHPGTRRVAVVSGASPADQGLRASATRELTKYGNQVELEYLSDGSMDRLVTEVARLPKGTVVLYVSLFGDAAGRSFDSARALSVLARASSAPIYGWSEAYLGHGIVGGRLLNDEAQGAKAGDLALRILRGEKPESLPIIDERPTGYLFDGRELQRWGISEGRLPPGSIVRYQSPSLWGLYRWHVIGGVLAFGCAFLLGGLVRQRTGRRRVELSLDERLRFESLLSELSANLIHISLNDLDREIEQGLQRVGEFLSVDRANLHEYVRQGSVVCLSWAVEGVEPLSRVSERDEFPWATQVLQRGHIVRFSRPDELPAEAAVDRQSFQASGTKSGLSLPLRAEGSMLGVLSFESIRSERAWTDELVHRLQLLSEVFTSALERRRAELALNERLRFETLLSELSAGFSALSAAHVDSEITRGLRRIVDFLEADQGRLLDFSKDNVLAPITHSWTAEGAMPPPAAVRLDELPWVVARLQDGEVVRFSRPEELPEQDAAVDRRTYLGLGVKSLVGVPLLVGAKVAGALVLTTLGTERTWRDDLVQRLRLFGEVLAQALSRRQSEIEAQQLRQDLAHVSRVATIGQLTTSLAHELNQPLTAILSNAQAAQRFLAAEPVDIEEVREILKDIIDDDKRAGEVIHRLRNLLKKGNPELRALDLNETVGEVARLVSGDALVRGVSIQLVLAPGIPSVRGDRVPLQQVVLNLVLNGMDAMRKSNPQDRILVLRTARESSSAVRVSVQDAGVGVGEANRDDLFQAFYTTKADGMGMGLAIARSIVEAHGGRLETQSNPGGGATFSFTLPLGEEGQ